MASTRDLRFHNGSGGDFVVTEDDFHRALKETTEAERSDVVNELWRAIPSCAEASRFRAFMDSVNGTATCDMAIRRDRAFVFLTCLGAARGVTAMQVVRDVANAKTPVGIILNKLRL